MPCGLRRRRHPHTGRVKLVSNPVPTGPDRLALQLAQAIYHNPHGEEHLLLSP